MPNYNSYYAVLNVVPDADPVVIEAAYKALMKKHHPDKHPAGPVAGERVAAELNRAWHVLRDADRRAAYDADEKARQERHRVELARAFPEPPPRGAAEPARRPAPVAANPRAGQRVAAWVGMAGIAVLIGAILILARGSDGLDAKLVASVTPPVVAQAAGRLPGLPGLQGELDEEAFRVLPVNRQQVFTAVAEFKRIAGLGGLPAAARVSERCFDAQRRSRGIGEFDYCVAFDHAASRTDLMPAAAAEPHFGPQTVADRHVRAAADSLSKDSTIIESRLFEIRRLTDSALIDFADPARLELAKLQQAPAPPAEATPPAARPTPRRAEPRPRPAAPRRAERPREEQPQDFLEREGGIY